MRDSGHPVSPSTGRRPETLVRVTDLTAGYGGPPALEGVSFAVEPGEIVGVLGPNGGGKSTLFRVLLGELAPAGGTVLGAPTYGYVPQTERSRLDYPVSGLDVALMGTLSRVSWWRRVGRSEKRFALEQLDRVGLRDRSRRQFGELSGGQRQRVLVARALVQDATVLLLDEPFSGLDQPSAEQLEALLRELAREGRGILIATHDVDQVRVWDRVLCLNKRQIAFGPPAETLTRGVLERTYGGSIISIPTEQGIEAGVLPPHHH